MDERLLKSPRRLGPLEWLIMLVSVGVLADSVPVWLRAVGFQWDISVYERAVGDYAQGVDAYRRDARFPFVYHPLTLRLLALLEHLLTLRVLLPALTLAAVGWLYFEFRRATARPAPSTAVGFRELGFVLLAAAGFGGVGAPALMSGKPVGAHAFHTIGRILPRREGGECDIAVFAVWVDPVVRSGQALHADLPRSAGVAE